MVKKMEAEKNYKIALIIDDDFDLCIVLKSILSDAFDNIQYTHTLQSGKELLTRLKPDIIFLDNNLPDGQGVNLIREIKESLPDSSVILITAMENSKEIAMKYGVDVFLEKPLTHAAIYHALDTVH
jgi:two-component system OmpR family response regulator